MVCIDKYAGNEYKNSWIKCQPVRGQSRVGQKTKYCMGGSDPQMGIGAFPVTRIWIWSKYLVEGCIPIVNYRDYANICTQWQCSLLPNQYGQLLVIKSECEIRLQAFVSSYHLHQTECLHRLTTVQVRNNDNMVRSSLITQNKSQYFVLDKTLKFRPRKLCTTNLKQKH